MKMSRVAGVVAVSLAACGLPLRAAEPAATQPTQIPTPASLLQAIATTQPAGSASAGTPNGIRQSIAAFATAGQTLPADEAARQWLALADQVAGLSQQQRYIDADEQPLQMLSVIAVLPPPASWHAIAQQLADRPKPVAANARRRSAALLLAHLLVGDRAAMRDDLAVVNKNSNAGASVNPMAYQNAMRGGSAAILQKFVADTTQPTDIAETVRAEIDGFRNSSNFGYIAPLKLPDLVTELGREKATQLLKLAFAAPVSVEVPVGDATRQLARQTALQSIDTMAAPQWALTNDLGTDSLALFEALAKKFPRGVAPQAKGIADIFFPRAGRELGEDDFRLQPFHVAQTYYILNLAVHDRAADALTAAKASTAGSLNGSEIDQTILSNLANQGAAESIQAFLHALLVDDPSRPFWSLYIATSAQVGKADEALALSQQAAARPGLTSKQRRETDAQVYKALLAADHVDGAIAAMRQLLEAPTSQPTTEPIAQVADTTGETNGSTPALDNSEGDTVRQVAIDLIQVGGVLERADLISEGIAALNDQQSRQANDTLNMDSYRVREVATALDAAGRPAEAATALADTFVRLVRSTGQADHYAASTGASDLLVELAGTYNRAGRHGDVLALLDNFPQWSAKDLAALYQKEDRAGTPLGYMAAAALADAGRKDEALRIDQALLAHMGGFDPAYELLLTLDPAGASPFLDDLFRRDQFEERPLIWKAELARRQGDFKASERFARQAIAIDPSDGEQGPGRRMRAYAVLADALDGQGNSKDATGYRHAVAAIRESEQGDRFRVAGLLTRAVALYADSLTKFSDAYCIQSRLARQQAELGMVNAAAEHYRRAFELMPVSFGRMESHCFGCEGAFRGPSAQGIAEQVFNDLLGKEPNKPQLHYLLGYLRQEQGRWPEAALAFETATKLDPDYINAWSHLAGCGEHVQLSDTQTNAAALAILRLDPLGRHITPDVSNVHEMAALYDAAGVAGRIKAQVVTPTALYPLRAAAARPKDSQINSWITDSEDAAPGNDGGQMLAKHAAIQAAATLIEGG